MTDRTTLFADGIMEANVAFGVARITLAQSGADGKPQPSGQLIVPLVQLPALANGLLTLLKQIDGKVKQQQQQQQAAEPAPAPAAAPAPAQAEIPGGAFRFSG